MPFSRDSLATLLDRVYQNYKALFKPIDQTPRYNLLKVFASSDAGMYHQLLGDLEFLSNQIFPDTAISDYLRLHWSDRVPPLHAVSAVGTIKITGVPGVAVPAGLVFASAAGKNYFTESAYRIGDDGTVGARVKADEAGTASNLGVDQELSMVSSIPVGVDSKAMTTDKGIAGGADGETDEDYLARVLLALRNTTRYGKPGDFAAWAVDSSAEVTKAWEFKNYSVFGALLIQVINGNQFDGVHPVGNLDIVVEYIGKVAPPILYTVMTPDIISINPSISLLPAEDTTENRGIVTNRLLTYLQATASPGVSYTAGQFRDAIIDGVNISYATVRIHGSTIGRIDTTVLQYPKLGVITWE